MRQRIFIFDSPDGTGKTEIGKELASRISLPYFKMTTEHENWRRGTFKEALRFDQTYILEFLRQTGYGAVIDRAYPAEWVYSRVFKRQTDEVVLSRVDSGFAELGTTIIIPLRKDYSMNRVDEVVPNEKLPELHRAYLEFAQWTKCNVIKLYVDDFDNDLDREIGAIYKGMASNDAGFRNYVAENGA